MPVPHFNIKITQRSKGKSAVAGAAYQAGEKLFSEYDQKTKNYTCKKEVVYTEIMLPPNAPPEYADRATLWNSVEEIEKQWNSQLARRFVVALPREVPMEMLPQMVKEYCEEHVSPNLATLLRDYLNLRKAERSEWSRYGQQKGTTDDLKTISQATVYLQQHELFTLEDLDTALQGV